MHPRNEAGNTVADLELKEHGRLSCIAAMGSLSARLNACFRMANPAISRVDKGGQPHEKSRPRSSVWFAAQPKLAIAALLNDLKWMLSSPSIIIECIKSEVGEKNLKLV